MNALLKHIGHYVTIVTYAEPVQNVSLECEDCNEVIISEEVA